jgi:VWFA-related protein
MRTGLLTILTLSCALGAAAQSARVKPTPSPTPNGALRPSVIFVPSARPRSERPKVAPSPTPVDSDEVVKVDSTLVPIPASVIDQSGRAVTRLNIADFDLRVDGKPAEIAELARSESPIRLALLFDNSSSVRIAREFEKEAAIRFFRSVIQPEKDLAALFSLADATHLEQPLTRNISQLVQAIEAFPPPQGATALLDGIIEVADYLGSADGRRVVVIVSDGEDTYSDYANTLERVVKELQLNNCQVFVVKTKDFENFKRTGQRGGNANIRALEAERRMLEITKQTGGAVYSPIDDRELDEAFRQISAELSQQYILSYYPDDDTSAAGQFREISLAVKGRPAFTVRTRKGYYVRNR